MFLPGAGDDQLLLAVDDREEAVVVDRADVAAVQPAVVVEQGGGRLGPLVVARGRDRPAHQHLAVLGDARARCPGRARPTRAEPEVVRAAGGGGAAGLGHARRCRRSPARGPAKKRATSIGSGAEAQPAQVTRSRPSIALIGVEHGGRHRVVPRLELGAGGLPDLERLDVLRADRHGALDRGLLARRPAPWRASRRGRTGSSPTPAGRRRTAAGRTSARAGTRRVGSPTRWTCQSPKWGGMYMLSTRSAMWA